MTIQIIHGDCREVLAEMAPNSFSAIVTDPPAGISFLSAAWDGNRGGRDQWIAWLQEIAAECLRVCKPGAHALVWALPRTSHWTATAWENAGWQVRDRVAHLFASGFPKSLDVSKAIDRAQDYQLQATVRRAAVEAVETAGLNLPGNSRWDWTVGEHAPGNRWWSEFQNWLPELSDANRERVEGEIVLRMRKAVGWFTNRDIYNITAPATEAARQWAGWGTALKPAVEDWWLLRKPLSEPSIAANVLKWGCGALNIDESRIPVSAGDRQSYGVNGDEGSPTLGVYGDRTRVAYERSPIGRWPANLCHDGSEEVLEAFAQFGTAGANSSVSRQSPHISNSRGARFNGVERDFPFYGDTGTAARFFFCGKATKDDRMETTHPTTKPTSLIKWLCKLVNPPGGTILDPFAGSGTFAVAAIRLDLNAVLIEQDAESIAMIHQRIRALEEETPLFPPDVESVADSGPAQLGLFDVSAESLPK